MPSIVQVCYDCGGGASDALIPWTNELETSSGEIGARVYERSQESLSARSLSER